MWLVYDDSSCLTLQTQEFNFNRVKLIIEFSNAFFRDGG